MPLLITTKLKDGGEGGHLALFLSLGIGWNFDLCLNSGEEVGGMCERTCVPIVYYAIPWLWFPLFSLGGRRYTFVDLNKRKVLA